MTTTTLNTNSDSALKQRILIVDDEAVIRELLQAYLEEHGYHVTTTESGVAAIRLAIKLPLHLIITDIGLADADGLEVLARIKKMRPNLPVIVMSGYSEADKMFVLAKQAGASACVSKSTPFSVLLSNIQNAINGRSHESSDGPDAVTEGMDSNASETGEKSAPADLPKATIPADDDGRAESDLGQGPELKANVTNVSDRNAPAIAAQINVAPGSERFDFGLEIFNRMQAAYHPNLANTAIRAVVVCGVLADSLRLSLEESQNLLWAAALHDIGLIRIDRKTVDQWLSNPDKLGKREASLIHRHPSESQRMLEFCPAFKHASEIILAHQEAWNGTGFPAGLKMEMIPWLSRLLSPVLFYCAKHNPNSKTIEDLTAQSDIVFDPKAVESVLPVLEGFTLPKGEREVLARDTRPGMVLASDLCNLDGILVIGKGTILNDATVSKIHRLSTAGQIELRILVSC